MTSPHDHTFPLTDLQAAYLVGASPLMELGGFRPNLYYELDVVGFDTERAEHAVRSLVDRHEHLRTVVLPEGSQRVLAPDEVTPFRLTTIDVVGADPEEQRAVLAATRERLGGEGPAPTGWPLFEITAVRLRRHRVRLHLAMSLLLLDSGSTRQLEREWWQLYLDPAVELPPVRGTFRECVAAAAARVDTPEYRTHMDYWQARLDDLPQAPGLPMARRPATIDPVRLTRRSFFLDRAQWQRLRAAFRARRVLPTTGLLHVYAETLGAWAAAPRFCLNVLHQNWTNKHPEAAGVVGQFSATLPLEVDLEAADTFWARAAALQKRLWRDLEHADVSAVAITRELAARRGWTSSAALPYVFNSMLGPAEQRPAAGPRCRTVHTGLRTPQVLIDNQTKDAPDGGVELVWDTVDEAFPEGLPQTLFDTYRRVLEELSGPEGGGLTPELLPPGHRDTVETLNRPAPAPEGRLEDGFLRQARQRPDATAVIAAGRTLTYGELDRASGALADRLAARGAGPGTVVPVVMAKGWEQIVAVLGVLRAGAAYCPVDASLPAERIARLLDACGSPVVLTQSHTEPELPDTASALRVDESATDEAPAAGARRGGAHDVAYVIYTSGSTGVPKGVVVEHRAALNTVVDVGDRIGLGPDDRVFGISSLSFDLSVWDVFATLGAGAALVLPAAGSRPDPVGWARCAARHGVTVWNSVPALAEMLVELVESEPDGHTPPVRAFLLSGDWIPTTLPDRMRRRLPGVRVLAMGGATEAAIWSNLQEVDEVDPRWPSIPYGVPLTGQTMRVLDHRLGLRPPWATGRIHIGGTGLARGYAGDAERTAERFLTHPHTGERLYWTGDLGRYWPDGTIEFLGREDRQLKIQGFRVEPGEVETALREHPGVAECAVCAVSAAGGGQTLVALVVPAGSEPPAPAELTTHLRERLPSYLVPGRLHLVRRLPLTANGKVDARAALALIEDADPAGAEAELDDRILKQLAEVWAELLDVPSVGPDSDFFALGGNSLLALRLVNRLRTVFGAELGFGEVFEAPTLRALGARLTDGERSRSCAVPLSEGAGPELVLFHPVGGSVSSYLPLARAWPGPVLGFQHPALGGGPETVDVPDLAALAAGYREELERLRPAGPYLLGGWSLGGVLAQEVARQLAERGGDARVVMVDSVVREHRVPADAAERQLEFLRDLAGGRLPGTVADAVRAVPADEAPAAALAAAVAHGLLPQEVDLAAHLRLSAVHTRNLALLAAHRPLPCALPTLLVVADGEARSGDPAADWAELCHDLRVVRRPRDHYSIVSGDELGLLAEELSGWLAQAGPLDGSGPEDGTSPTDPPVLERTRT
ncbi:MULTISPECIES: amino acid adenylation domain-containing protein [unclassified Streptomyces]|uniref:non-ribosomal peptide synthetase n=1 Tax=unclassified Streptomyces TaxID=2593676 RepID=UPI00278C2BD6|nr:MULTISPECIES: amino acid adenylation domain-containing protein [unclassified Streptomyces]